MFKSIRGPDELENLVAHSLYKGQNIISLDYPIINTRQSIGWSPSSSSSLSAILNLQMNVLCSIILFTAWAEYFRMEGVDGGGVGRGGGVGEMYIENAHT